MSRIASGLFSACFLVLCLLSCQASASDALPTDSDYYLYKTITKADGLSQLSVYDIKQDNEGYFWLATAGGLYRFDGVNLKKFEAPSSSANSISHLIRNIFVDTQGSIWVGTQHGLLVKNADHNEINNVLAFNGQTIWAISQLSDQLLLVSTQDTLWLFDKESRKKTELLKVGKIKSIYSDQKRTLLGTFSDGLYFSGKDFRTLENTLRFGKKINKIEEKNSKVYIASDEGLFETDDTLKAKKTITDGNVIDFYLKKESIIVAKSDGIYLSRKGKEEIITKEKGWSVYSAENSLYVGTNTKGVIIFKREPSSLSNIKLPLGETGSYVSSMGFINDILYLTSNTGVLYVYDYKHNRLVQRKSNQVSSIFSSSDSLLLYEGSIIEVINKDGDTSKIDFPENGKILKARKNKYWYLIDNQQQLFILKDKLIKKIPIPQGCQFGYANLLKITDNKIFIGGDSGLCSYDKDSLKDKKLSNIWIKSSISDDNSTIFISKQGDLIDSEGKRFFDLTLDSGEDIYSSSLSVKDGEDYLLISSSKGLRVYSSPFGSPKLIDFFDTRYHTLEEYAAGSVGNNEKGAVFFGGIGGISIINVDKLRPNISIGTLQISDVRLYNEEKVNLLDNINKNATITLENHQYPLTLGISLLKYSFPDKAHFQYKLSSFGDKWFNFDGLSSITLSKLEAGLHKIQFRAIDKSSIVAESHEYSINVLPPWWYSNTAFFFYSLTILGIAIHIFSIIKNRRQQHDKLVESEERLKLALWGSGDELWDWDIKSGNIYRSNIWNDFSLPDDGFRSKDDQSNIYPKDLERVKSTLQACLSGEKEEFEVAYRVHDKTMNWVWVLDRGRVVEHDDNGLPGRMTGTLKNISHLKKTEEMLKLLATSFKNISDAVCIVDQDFVILEINDSFTAITGQSREEAVGQTWNFSLYNDSFIEQVKQTLDRAGRWHDEIEAKRKNGVIYPIEITIDKVFDEEKDSYNFVAVFSDISERKEKEKELERLTNTDTLTGLPNRSFFMSTLDRQVRKGQHFALLLLDLNNFKQINDSLGHQLGDLLLIEVAERLQKAMQSNHTLYRLGGDEFAVIIDSFNKLDDLTRLSTELHQQLLTPFNLLGEELTMSCAIGAVLYPDDGLSPEHLLRNADAAMYHAKHEGSETCQFFSSSMNEQASARLAIENRIRKALREDLFNVYYQPKVETLTGRCTGAEALLRLPDGKGGFISPAEFIPIAEESGLILDVGNWVLEASCRQVKVWHEQGIFPGRIAINLSARQFRHSDLVAQIDKVLAETQLPAHILEMEITESTMMEDPIRAIAVMERLRSRNITLAMDDFGTGYSSLSNLRQFPVTSVKIDRAFVKDLTSDQGAKNLTGAIISLADSLALHVVAEGVETAEQLAILKDLNCPTCQGFLFGRPVPAREFEELVTKNGGMLGPENTNN